MLGGKHRKADDWKGKWDLRVAHKGFIICDSRILSFPTISPTFGRHYISFGIYTEAPAGLGFILGFSFIFTRQRGLRQIENKIKNPRMNQAWKTNKELENQELEGRCQWFPTKY